MTTLPTWLLGILLILAGYGLALIIVVIKETIDEMRIKRKSAYKNEYKALDDWIDEIERELLREQ